MKSQRVQRIVDSILPMKGEVNALRDFTIALCNIEPLDPYLDDDNDPLPNNDKDDAPREEGDTDEPNGDEISSVRLSTGT